MFTLYCYEKISVLMKRYDANLGGCLAKKVRNTLISKDSKDNRLLDPKCLAKEESLKHVLSPIF